MTGNVTGRMIRALTAALIAACVTLPAVAARADMGGTWDSWGPDAGVGVEGGVSVDQAIPDLYMGLGDFEKPQDYGQLAGGDKVAPKGDDGGCSVGPGDGALTLPGCALLLGLLLLRRRWTGPYGAGDDSPPTNGPLDRAIRGR